MKKIIPVVLVLLALFIGCKKNSQTEITVTAKVDAISQRTCGAYEVLQQQLKADPSMRSRMDQIESFTKKVIGSGEFSRLVNGAVEIPVVVNVLYKSAAENISQGQIQSQIDVLNADYSGTNGDQNNTPALFKGVIGKVAVKFVLNKIVRRESGKTSWPPNDAMKKTANGGIDPTDPAHNLNMWSCNLGQSLLGYAQFPGGNPATDGVVILYAAFGSRTINPGGTYISKYDLGRTASHEVGHWMNLYHIWGDDGGSCAGSDLVDDTPNQGNLNFGCPVFPHISCGNNGDMSMNYMDYTDDACMFMFTKGQSERMLAVFAAGGPRDSFRK